jgi:hypothetical protein
VPCRPDRHPNTDPPLTGLGRYDRVAPIRQSIMFAPHPNMGNARAKYKTMSWKSKGAINPKFVDSCFGARQTADHRPLVLSWILTPRNLIDLRAQSHHFPMQLFHATANRRRLILDPGEIVHRAPGFFAGTGLHRIQSSLERHDLKAGNTGHREQQDQQHPRHPPLAAREAPNRILHIGFAFARRNIFGFVARFGFIFVFALGRKLAIWPSLARQQPANNQVRSPRSTAFRIWWVM